MSRHFSARALMGRLASLGGTTRLTRDPRFLVRAVLGVLLAANLVAAYFVVRPLGGSPEELDAQAVDLEKQILQARLSNGRLQQLKAKAVKARDEGDRFLGSYFTDRRTASSNIVFELNRMAKESQIRPKDHTFTYEPIEGSDTLLMMVINGNYEGTYADLMHYLNRLDRSPRFVIVDSLSASPQAGNAVLAVQMKLYTFVKEGGSPEEAQQLLKQTGNETPREQPGASSVPMAAAPAPAPPRAQPSPTGTAPVAPPIPIMRPSPVPSTSAGVPPDGTPRWQGPPDQDPNNPNYRPLRPGRVRRPVTPKAEDQ